MAKALARPTCRYSGFECEIPATALALGEHVLSLKIFTNDQKSYYTQQIRDFGFSIPDDLEIFRQQRA